MADQEPDREGDGGAGTGASRHRRGDARREPGQRARRRCQCAASRRAPELREGHRAVRRHDHAAHDRSRLVRHRQRHHADVRARRDRSDPRIRRCAADRGAERQGRHDRLRHVARVRRPRVPRQGHALGRRARSRSPYDVDRDPDPEPGWRADAGHVRARRDHAAGAPQGRRDSGDRALQRLVGVARRDRRCQAEDSLRADHDRARYGRHAVGGHGAHRRRARRQDRRSVADRRRSGRHLGKALAIADGTDP